MTEDQSEPSGTSPVGKRAARNTRAAEREREAQYPEAVRLISEELATLVDLRGRIAVAKAILARGGDRQAAIDVLNGHAATSETEG